MEPTDDIQTEEIEGVTALETLAIWLGLDGVCTGEGMPAYLGSLVESWKSECMSWEPGTFEPPLPGLCGTLEPISWAKEFKTVNTYAQKLTNTPFGNEIFITENVSLYMVTPFDIRMYIEISNKGPPFTDTFSVHCKYTIKE